MWPRRMGRDDSVYSPCCARESSNGARERAAIWAHFAHLALGHRLCQRGPSRNPGRYVMRRKGSHCQIGFPCRPWASSYVALPGAARPLGLEAPEFSLVSPSGAREDIWQTTPAKATRVERIDSSTAPRASRAAPRSKCATLAALAALLAALARAVRVVDSRGRAGRACAG